ncbi:MAG TPA: hypothetical protein VHY48_05025 [Acidobacteriaceae bacterium]|jgi:hypothetical protein|nr:hypothetical protein [Acidobacteriaceae bacterium]
MIKARLFLLLAAIAVLSAALSAQMVNPDIDAGTGPFSYYSQPTDEIGVMDGPSGTLISPEGFLYTGYGELMFFTGNPAVPIHQRVKTLLRGYLPVIQYGFTRGGVRYQFECFAATLDGKPSGTQVNFIRVQIQNTKQEPRVAWLSSGMRYEGTVDSKNGRPDNRFPSPAVPQRPGDYSQPGVVFNSHWAYSSGRDTIDRDDQVLYYFPETPQHTVSYMLEDDPDPSGILASRVLPAVPTTPVGIVRYKLSLKPGEQVNLDWTMPVIPVTAGSPLAERIQGASFDKYLSRTIAFWEQILHQGMDLDVPEAKVNNAFRASLVYDLIARNKIGNDYVQTVNNLHYHAFWLRDASFIARMYDLTGYPEYARQVINFFAQWQKADGNFLSQGGQFDGVGQVLWAYGQHYSITRDRAFAAEVFPAVERAVAWIEQARQSDSLHLLPATTPGDNERITGHVTGHNFWALDGIQNAIVLAQASGHAQQAAQFQEDYNNYHAALMTILDRVTRSTQGYIPPGLDSQQGQDWGNMLSIYPSEVLSPNNPMVTATLNATRAKYKEGIMTYDNGHFLHDYVGFNNMETELILGHQQLAVQDLYAELVHTSSTQAGFETNVVPWGDRDFHYNLAPHGWFAARLRIALRNMFIREQGDDLHLLSAISPAWIQPGREMLVDHAPTTFGMVGLSMRILTSSRAELTLHDHFVHPPAHIILHLPWFMETSKVVADGVSLPVRSDSVYLPRNVRTVQIEWRKQASAPSLNYQAAVAQYKAEYAAHYKQFLRTGN